MKKIKGILEKIKEIILKIFNKQSVKLLDQPELVEEEIINTSDYSKDNIDNENKKDIFIIYENIKNGIIKPEELMINDLIKVQLMMKNELDVIDKKITISESEIVEMGNEISDLKKERIYYTK